MADRKTITGADMTLCDDGTLDTVFRCGVCGEEIRFSDMSHHRDESGAMLESGLVEAAEEHDEECGL